MLSVITIGYARLLSAFVPAISLWNRGRRKSTNNGMRRMNCLSGGINQSQQVAHSREAAERANPRLKAFTVLNPEPFRPRPELPIDGLPIGVKDLYDTAGLETAYGSP